MSVVNRTVNISLISALLVIYSLWELSTEKLSWDYWHEWMKRNAEVATNIDIKQISRFPVLKILVTVVLGLWPAGNIYQIR